jgi:RNA polymerase sigma-70 factor, ECF subfamily
MFDTQPRSRSFGQGTALETILAQVALGNREAFDALYRDTASRLFGICLRVLAERTEAEDTLQDVFTTVWRKAAQFDATRASAMAWLAMIARNKAIDRLRSMPARQARAALELAQDIEDPSASPAQQAQAATDRERLERCLELLEPRRRSLVRAAFFDGSTYEELAARARAPLGSIKSWIRRSLLQLRQCLEP